jgi:signal transduction histidine kinase
MSNLADLQHYNILIVDDNPTNLSVLSKYLERLGFEILAARDGESAIRIATLANPGIILLDVMMPGLNGFDTCRQLKTNPATQAIPIIFMTALSSTKDKIKGFEAGAVDYITKPFESSEVLARVTTHLRLRQLTENLEEEVAHRTHQLNKAYHRLERLDRIKTDFIHITSHELRTPLNIVSGYTQVLHEDAQNAYPELVPLLEHVLSGTQRMTEILELIFDITQTETRQLQLHYQPCNLLDIFTDLAKRFKTPLQERNLHLNYTALSHLPPLAADDILLRKMLYHLLVNAIKYTPNGGQITVSGKETHLNTAPALEICLRDSGIGIAAEHLDLIFEKFYQTGPVAFHSSGRTSFKGGGPGLGLNIVRNIVHAHKGRVWAESDGYSETTYPGSCFYVQLPRQAPTTPHQTKNT